MEAETIVAQQARPKSPALNPLIQQSKLSCQNFKELLEASRKEQQERQEQQHQQHKGTLLVLDLRSFLSYNQSHVKSSINVCIPKTLAKRQGFTVKSIDSGICRKGDKDEFMGREGATVVVYDQNGEWQDGNSLLSKCFESLVAEGSCKKVLWLEGGFARLQKECPEVVQSAHLTETMRVLVTPKITSRLTLTMSAPLTAPVNVTTLADEPIVEVTDFLYLSGSNVADSYATLKKNNIKHIINCAAELPDTFEHLNEFKYKRLDLQDTPSQHMCFVNIFDNAFKVIDEARAGNQRTLVHCRGGRSRSATVVIAYLMRTFSWSLQQAYDFLQQKNPKISPNLGFMGQLIGYEAKLKSFREQKSGEGLTPPLEIPHLNHLAQSPRTPRTPQSLETIDGLGSTSLGIVS